MRRIINFIKAVLGICETKPLSQELWSVEEGKVARVKLGETAELQEKGMAVYLKGQGLDKPILLVRAEGDQYLAFSNRCTHGLHRRLDPMPGVASLRCCSLGHSTFDYEGNPISGPAKDPLTCYEVESSEGDLLVKLGLVEEAKVEAPETTEMEPAEAEAEPPKATEEE